MKRPSVPLTVLLFLLAAGLRAEDGTALYTRSEVLQPAREPSLPLIDHLRRRPTVSFVNVCPDDAAGECLLNAAATVLCACECDQGLFHPRPSLLFGGDLYLFSGPYFVLKRPPKTDRSVVDALSAEAHAYRVHLRPALAETSLQTRSARHRPSSTPPCRPITPPRKPRGGMSGERRSRSGAATVCRRTARIRRPASTW